MICFCFVVVSLFFNTTFHSSDKRDVVQFVHPRLSIGRHYGHCTLPTYRPTGLPTSRSICRWTVGERHRRVVLRSYWQNHKDVL